jgi:hypothetical protein
VSAQHTDYERWVLLVDRQACDQPLSAEELEFCRTFAHKHALCDAELAAYGELSDFNGAPTDSSRGLVDRTLQRLEAEDAERAAADIRLLRRPRVPAWLAVAGTVAIGLCTVYVVHSSRVDGARESAARDASDRAGDTNHEASGARGPSEPIPAARAELVYTSGDVTIAGTNSGVGRTLLAEGSVVETAAGGACVLIDADINICLAAHSRMRLTAIATAARRVELEVGALATRLNTQPEGMSLTIVAGGVSSTAVGTAFAVELASDRTVLTTVLNGKVRVGRDASTTALVRAHERAVSARNSQEPAAPRVSAVSRQDESPSWALLGATVLWHDPVAATLEVRGDPVAAEVWLDEQWVGVTPLSTLLPVGEHHLTVSKAGKELSNRELRLHAGESIVVDYRPAPPTAATPHSKAGPVQSKHAARVTVLAGVVHGHAEPSEASPVPLRSEYAAREASVLPNASATRELVETTNGSDLLRRARQAVRAGHFSEAARSYENLVNSYAGSDEAQAALVLLGQLRLTRLNDPHGALEALNSYLRTGGSLEIEAQIARIDALHALKRSAEEATAIDDFLQQHPRSFEAKALRARRSAPAN